MIRTKQDLKEYLEADLSVQPAHKSWFKRYRRKQKYWAERLSPVMFALEPMPWSSRISINATPYGQAVQPRKSMIREPSKTQYQNAISCMVSFEFHGEFHSLYGTPHEAWYKL